MRASSLCELFIAAPTWFKSRKPATRSASIIARPCDIGRRSNQQALISVTVVAALSASGDS